MSIVVQDITEECPETDESPETPTKYELAIGALCKNESDSILEWITHYLYHGVQHFYLINDASTDNTVEIIQPYIDSGIITLFDARCKYFLGRQRFLYNKYILPRVNSSEMKWLMISDVDEYVWSQESRDLKDVFRQCSHLAQIQYNHTLFGSNGHIQQPTGGLVRNFTRRSQTRPTESIKNYKYAVNSAFKFESLNIHHATASDEIYMKCEFFMQLGEPYFLMNHYSCQSLNFWNEVKCTRGDGDHYLVRDMEQFRRYDINEVEDIELLEQNRDISGSPALR
jgi:hypothetical protein